MVRPKDDDPAGRKKILAAAETIFAERGFDGARVDDIAAKAGVNKALIYYYFKSKDEILDALFARFMAMILEHSSAVRDNPGKILSDGFLREDFLSTFEFLHGRKNILRIIMMESLKKTKRTPLLIKALDASREYLQGTEAGEIMAEMRRKGLQIEGDLQPLLVNEFFTKSLPTVFFVLFEKAWTDHFGVAAGDLREWFIRAMGETHIAYHRRSK